MVENTKDKFVKYPGVLTAIDGNTTVIMGARDYNRAAGAFPITPSTPQGERYAEQVNNGYRNTEGKPHLSHAVHVYPFCDQIDFFQASYRNAARLYRRRLPGTNCAGTKDCSTPDENLPSSRADEQRPLCSG